MNGRTSIPVILLSSAMAAAQATPPPSLPSMAAANPWEQLPRTLLSFSKQVTLTGVPQSPLIIEPIQCSSSGVAFLQILLPPQFMSRAFVGIDKSGKVTVFANGTNLTGVATVRQLALYAAQRNLYSLVEMQSNTLEDATGGSTHRGPWKTKILKYAHDGSVESSTALDVPFLASRFAVLPSGEIIVMGVETKNSGPVAPQLVELDSGGGNLRPLDIFGSNLYSPDALGRFFPEAQTRDFSDPTSLAKVIGSVQFVGYGDDVLLVQTRTNYPVVEIGQAGILRSVQLHLPSGVVIESILPSSGRQWYVRVLDSRRGPAIHRMMLFDPDTGEALRQISAVSTPLESIACEADGSFLAFRQVPDSSSQYGRLTLTIASE